MKRYLELDVVRGFLLVLMVVNHSTSPLRRFTEGPFGFFSTAEAFVFISALLAGLLFERRSEQHGFSAARAATLRRALRIYQAHIESFTGADTHRHVAPHVPWVTSLWAVLTRMKKPMPEKYPKGLAELMSRLSPLDKALLYAGESPAEGFLIAPAGLTWSTLPISTAACRQAFKTVATWCLVRAASWSSA